MSKHDWTDQLPELFEGFTEAEPDGLWDAVQGSIAPAEKKEKKAAAWWWYGAAGVLAAACIALGVFLFRPSSTDSPLAAVPGNLAAVTPDNDPDDRASQMSPQKDSLAELARPLPTFPASSQSENLSPSGPSPYSCPGVDMPFEDSSAMPDAERSKNSGGDDITAEATTISETSEEQPVIETDQINEPVRQEWEKAGQNQPEIDQHIADEDIVVGGAEKSPNVGEKRPFRIQLRGGVSSGGYLAQDISHTTSGFGLQTVIPGMPVTKATGEGLGGFSPMMVSRNKASTNEATHSQSARLGFTLQATVNDRWGFETGITTTRLESRYISTSGSATSETERTMHYLGIPLFAHYNIFSAWDRLNFYAVGGPMFEWAYKTRTVTTTTLGSNASMETDLDNIRDRRWSLNAGVGLQLRLLPGFWLYAQPGLSWHLSNGTELENAFTEKPLSPEVTFGIRASF